MISGWQKRGRRGRGRRGISLVEVLIGSGISLGLLVTLAGFSRFQGMVWLDGMANSTTQAQAEAAIGRMAPVIRTARRVLVGQSTATRLTLQTPATNPDGSCQIPLTDGAILSFYLSDTTGSPAKSGNILWRSVNGTPDTAWSLQNGRGRTTLNTGGLFFAYLPNNTDPEAVLISLQAYAAAGNRSSTLAISEEVLLRNKGL